MASSTDRRIYTARLACRSGQAMVESLIVMLVTCVLLFGLLQVAHAFAGREILRHAAARAARARTVGFNYWMCEKVMRVAAIPTSGKMIEPQVDGHFDTALAEAISAKKSGALWDWSIGAVPKSERGELEAARIPNYLASVNDERAEYILDYELWDEIGASGLGGGESSTISDENTLTVKVRQNYPLDIFVRALNDWVGVMAGGSEGKDHLSLTGEFNIESHFPLYIDDHGY